MNIYHVQIGEKGTTILWNQYHGIARNTLEAMEMALATERQAYSDAGEDSPDLEVLSVKKIATCDFATSALQIAAQPRHSTGETVSQMRQIVGKDWIKSGGGYRFTLKLDCGHTVTRSGLSSVRMTKAKCNKCECVPDIQSENDDE